MSQTIKIARGKLAKKTGGLAYGELFIDNSAKGTATTASPRGMYIGLGNGENLKIYNGDGDGMSFRGIITSIADLQAIALIAKNGEVWVVAAELTSNSNYSDTGAGMPSSVKILNGEKIPAGTYIIKTDKGLVKVGGAGGGGVASGVSFNPTASVGTSLQGSLNVQDALERLSKDGVHLAGYCWYVGEGNINYSTPPRVGLSYMILGDTSYGDVYSTFDKASNIGTPPAKFSVGKMVEPVIPTIIQTTFREGDVITITSAPATATVADYAGILGYGFGYEEWSYTVIPYAGLHKPSYSITNEDWQSNSAGIRFANLEALYKHYIHYTWRYGGAVNAFGETTNISVGNVYKYMNSNTWTDAFTMQTPAGGQQVALESPINFGDLVVIVPANQNGGDMSDYTPAYWIAKVIPSGNISAKDSPIDGWLACYSVAPTLTINSHLNNLAWQSFRYGGEGWLDETDYTVHFTIENLQGNGAGTGRGGNLFKSPVGSGGGSEYPVKLDLISEDGVTTTLTTSGIFLPACTQGDLIKIDLTPNGFVFSNLSSTKTAYQIPYTASWVDSLFYNPLTNEGTANTIAATTSVGDFLKNISRLVDRWGGVLDQTSTVVYWSNGNFYQWTGPDTPSKVVNVYIPYLTSETSYGKSITLSNLKTGDLIKFKVGDALTGGGFGADDYDVSATIIRTGARNSSDIKFTGADAARASSMAEAVHDAGDDALTTVDGALKRIFQTKADVGADGKIPIDQIPDTVIGAMDYQGTFDFNYSVTPRLPTAADKPITTEPLTKGDYWVCINPTAVSFPQTTLDGTTGANVSFSKGDWIIYRGNGKWDKMGGTAASATFQGIRASNTNLAGIPGQGPGTVGVNTGEVTGTAVDPAATVVLDGVVKLVSPQIYANNNPWLQNPDEWPGTTVFDEVKIKADVGTGEITFSIPAGMFQHTDLEPGRHVFKDPNNPRFYCASGMYETATDVHVQKGFVIDGDKIIIGGSTLQRPATPGTFVLPTSSGTLTTAADVTAAIGAADLDGGEWV